MISVPKLLATGLAAGLLAASPALAQQAPAKPKALATPAAPAAAKPTGTATPAKPVAPAVTDDTKKFLRFSPEHPVAGETLTIAYSPADGPLLGKAGIRGIVYYFDVTTLRWDAHDLPLQPGGALGELAATFTPPVSSGCTVFKFVSADGTTDNLHDQGYFKQLRDPGREGLPAAGGYLSWGLLRQPGFGYGIPGYFQNFTIKDEALMLWFKQELRFHPENAPALMPQLLAVTRAVDPKFTPKPFAEYAPYVLRMASRQVAQQASPREIDLLGIEQGYRSLDGYQAQADSVAQLLAQHFPQGYLARLAQVRAIQAERDPARQLARWQAFLAAYPPSPAYQPPARYVIDYNRIYENIILVSMAQKDYRAVATYAPQLHYNGLLNIYYKAVQVSIRPGIRTAAEALPDATLLIERIDQLRAQRPAEFSYLSPLEWQAHFDQTSNPWRIHYAGLLAELGQPAKAITYVETAQRIAGFGNATLNDTQAGLLHAGGVASAAPLRQVLEASVHHNQASPRMLDWLRESYTAAHPGGAGYEQYLAGLQDADAKRKARAELATRLLDQPVNDFALRDLDGKLVRLSDQKGKTVVLDLWATWCMPCKASFPGMKLAQERFKNEPGVVFYFIDTEETELDYKQQVRDYLTAKGFPFRVLFDQPAPGTKTMDGTYARICKDYHVSGIPQKLIIDPQGRLRFLTTGYKGSPTALADEIEAMVELARAAK